MNEPDVIETKTSRLWIDEEGILHGVIKLQAEEMLDDARANVAAAKELAAGCKMLVIIDMRGMKSITREARDRYAGDETWSYSKAQALLVDSPVSRTIGNFAIRLSGHQHPIKLFSSKTAALEWLRRQD